MQTLRKEERLAGKKKIEELFSSGKSFYVKSFKVIWLFQDDRQKYPVSVLITVSKRYIKKAVDRNLIKRRIREAYRKNKQSLYAHLEPKNGHLNLALIYSNPTLATYKEIEEKIILILQRLQSEYDKDLR
jgi:ribonuclease P protein component